MSHREGTSYRFCSHPIPLSDAAPAVGQGCFTSRAKTVKVLCLALVLAPWAAASPVHNSTALTVTHGHNNRTRRCFGHHGGHHHGGYNSWPWCNNYYHDPCYNPCWPSWPISTTDYETNLQTHYAHETTHSHHKTNLQTYHAHETNLQTHYAHETTHSHHKTNLQTYYAHKTTHSHHETNLQTHYAYETNHSHHETNLQTHYAHKTTHSHYETNLQTHNAHETTHSHHETNLQTHYAHEDTYSH
ncbi:hypothetical protein E2C01_008549 [Portunus trituberculatus]|uniref:Uncharacterized protein n=1 Tax=Portunus trituberculatus TaxID=210409 RepID=A0A5B7D137_PORTR|nr:hypothetical protein [Portunus trituberculatus]